MSRFDLTGRAAIVTGGNGGIGHIPSLDTMAFWGAFGCSCWAF